MAEQQGVAAEVRSRLESLSAKENVLPGRLEELQAQRESAKSQLAAQRSSLAERSAQSEQMEQLVTRGMKMYKKLGLDFVRVGDDRLKLNFQMLDPKAPQREFWFIVFVDEVDNYHIESIEPAMENTQELVEELNTSNDFSLFVRRMRARFQASVC